MKNQDSIEKLFFESGIDLLVDGEKMFLPADAVVDLVGDGVAEEQEAGLVVKLNRHRFRFGRYNEEVDGYPLILP